jgi:hypothetical protein
MSLAGEEMKKSVNRFSVAIWAFAGIYLIVTLSALYLLTSETVNPMDNPAHPILIRAMVSTIPSGIFHTTLLAAFGYIIELLDQIRWSLRSSQKI